ncbi:MAG: hypothetical protein [Caudoviricetes sp.]|nr:MAG: hypothetical protein [Caudoviricetes sp.]
MIDKAVCQGVENALKSGLSVTFLHQDNEITVRRCLISETKLVYAIYINGEMYFAHREEGQPHYHPMAKTYSRKVIYYPYQKIVNKIKKERGGKTALKRKEYAYLLEKHERFELFFPSAKAAINHFKKIDGLTVKDPQQFEA